MVDQKESLSLTIQELIPTAWPAGREFTRASPIGAVEGTLAQSKFYENFRIWQARGNHLT